MSGLLKLRSAQDRYLRLVDEYRLTAFLARRQYGKTTTFSAIALKKMMKRKNHTVLFGSITLNLSREIVRKESAVIRGAIEALRSQQKEALQMVDAISGKSVSKISADDFAELFEAQRFEFRYYHSRTSYSRTKVVAITPDTVGETGDLMTDEVGRVRNFRDVFEAVEPIIASDPTFRWTLCTTPPPDDKHFSYEMLCPPPDLKFEPNKEGNIYTSMGGVKVLRVDAWDAALDGVPVFDTNTGEPLTPRQHFDRSMSKDAWRRNYGCEFIVGGSAVCGIPQLNTAQSRGHELGCRFFEINSDEDFQQCATWLRVDMRAGNKIGVGLDIATTNKQTSNPTSVTVMGQNGPDFVAHAIIVWKTSDPAVAKERIRQIVSSLSFRKDGRPRALCIDATSEKYFAEDLKRFLAPTAPVRLIVASESLEIPGRERTNWKEYLGERYVSSLNDNRLVLPPEHYIYADHRLVMKDKGRFLCEPDGEGRHGDTFDSSKLAQEAVAGFSSGPVLFSSGNPSHGSRGDTADHPRSLGSGRFSGRLT